MKRLKIPYSKKTEVINIISNYQLLDFDLILEEYLKAKQTLAKSTLNSYKTQMKHFAKECKKMGTTVFEAQEGHIASYLSDYEYLKTKKSYKTILNSFYRWIVKKSYIIQNPVEDIPIKSGKEKEIIPMREIDYKQFLGRCESLREVTIISFLWYTGVRAKELVGMRIKDIDLKRNTIFVSDSKTSAGYRKIPIHVNFKNLFTNYISRRKNLDVDSPYLFLTLHGKKMSYRTLLNIVENLQSGWDGPFACHDFRRAFITRIYRKTKDIVLCQKLAGHTSIATTRKYIIDDPEELAEKFNSIDF